MAATAIVTISVVVQGTPSQTIEDRHICSDSGNPVKGIEGLRDLLDRMASGLEKGCVHVFVDKADGTQATGSVVLTQASLAAGDTLTIGNVVLTVRATPSSDPRDGEWAAGASDTAAGDNLAAAVNAHPLLKALCTASNNAGTVTFTMVNKGTHGNLCVIAKSSSGIATPTQFASGAKGTVESAARVFNRGQ